MRAVLATHGTVGSLEPLLPIALGLQQRGHSAIIAAPPHIGRRAQALGLSFAPLGPDLDQDELARVFGGARAHADGGGQALHVTEASLRHLGESYEDLSRACQGADVLLSFPAQLASLMVQERTKIPFASIHYSPFGALGTKQMGEMIAPTVNAARAALGFGPLTDPLGQDGFSTQLALFAVSPVVFRRPKKWPPHYRLTGYMFLDDPHPPDAQLSAFVANGEPPVVVTFGSMIHDDAAAMTRILIDAAEQVGCRAIIQQGWSGLGSGVKSDRIFVAGFAPHGWLFPRASCVVHAGGAGTTAAVLKAGVPQVIVPHWLDQPMWGQLMLGMGCASSVIPEKQLSAEKLAAAITAANGARHREKAAKAASQIQAEDGVGVACDLLLRLSRGEDVTA